MKITRKSIISGIERTLEIPNLTQEQFNELREINGKFTHPTKLIQDFLPDLTEDEREFILTGISKEEWNHLFSSGYE